MSAHHFLNALSVLMVLGLYAVCALLVVCIYQAIISVRIYQAIISDIEDSEDDEEEN